MKRSVLLAVMLAGWMVPAAGQSGTGLAQDPTKPPAAYLAGATLGAVAVASAPLSRLTSVMLPKHGGRASAVIDGQVLRIGDKLGESQLRSVTESTAILEGPQGRETLYLIPDINKTPAASRQGARPSAKEKR